jgi:hypothetical protein
MNKRLLTIGLALFTPVLLAACDTNDDYATLQGEVVGLREDYATLESEFATFRSEWGTFYEDWEVYRTEVE